MHYITAAALQLFLLLSQSSFGAVSREDEAHPFDDSKVRRLWEVAERREEQHDLRGASEALTAALVALQHSGGGDASAPRNDSVFWRILEEETSEPAEGVEERGGGDVNRPTATVLTFTALCRLHALRGIMPLAFSACVAAYVQNRTGP